MHSAIWTVKVDKDESQLKANWQGNNRHPEVEAAAAKDAF